MYNGGANKLPSERKCVNNNCRPPPRPPKVPETQCPSVSWSLLLGKSASRTGPCPCLRATSTGVDPCALTSVGRAPARSSSAQPSCQPKCAAHIKAVQPPKPLRWWTSACRSISREVTSGAMKAQATMSTERPALARTSGDMPASRYAATASRLSLCTKLSNDSASSSSRKYPRARRRGIAGRRACSTAKSNGLAAGPLDPKSGDLPAEVSKKSSSRMASHPTEGRPFSRAQRLSSSNADSSHAVALFGGE
mmetsp:Transcript_562/g.1683  ORF Transcript_562/g.1683 Transcript_562/m.1683 type:complete len:251 (+) Transcript_562:174-926(+)